VRVPEAAVHKDYFLPCAEDEVGRPRQIAPVQAVSEPHGVYQTSDRHLGARVSAADRCHALAALRRGQGIDH
jgi:hypothetical protein